MNEEYAKQCSDGRCGLQKPNFPQDCDCHDHHDRQDRCDCDRRDCCENRRCDTDGNGADWESWLPILIILFFLCGGFSGLGFGGGNQCGDNCCDNNSGSWSWILILIILFCFLNNGNGNDGGGGLFGGLF